MSSPSAELKSALRTAANNANASAFTAVGVQPRAAPQVHVSASAGSVQAQQQTPQHEQHRHVQFGGDAAALAPPSSENATFNEYQRLHQTFDRRATLSSMWTMLKAQTPEEFFPADIRLLVKLGREDTERFDEETQHACQYLEQAMRLRERYVFRQPDPPLETPGPLPNYDPFSVTTMPGDCDFQYRLVNGVYLVFDDQEALDLQRPTWRLPDMYQFFTDLGVLMKIVSFGGCKSFCYARLKLLQARFELYYQLNEDKEFALQKQAAHGRDFYNVFKVDTHVHHAACMNQKSLLKFIKYKIKAAPNDVIRMNGSIPVTLRDLFAELQLNPSEISVDTLNVHAGRETFQRFDRFNAKYNPFGVSGLREVFLKTDNFIKGRYLAEITQSVFADLEKSKYQLAEYRVSIYGRTLDEWDRLAAWVVDHKLFSRCNRWMVQIPRLYSVHHERGMVKNYEEFIRNIFQPLFEVTKNPQSHPKLHIFLQQVTGFDCVDDESKSDRRLSPNDIPRPPEWNTKHDPPYSYVLYFLYINLHYLNLFRLERGFSTLTLRPHAGEAGDLEHLAVTYLLAHGINHGINLRHSPVLQYLYYLKQVGLAVSPLSNNSLFLDYQRSPFHKFFQRGLNVSLSSDDPLLFHFTREPLLEEYSIAAQMWKLSTCDLCEIARNSVLQCGFEHSVKAYWLGPNYLMGVKGNEVRKSNVPDIRLAFREELLNGELDLVSRIATHTNEKPKRMFMTPLSPNPIFLHSSTTDTPPVSLGQSERPRNDGTAEFNPLADDDGYATGSDDDADASVVKADRPRKATHHAEAPHAHAEQPKPAPPAGHRRRPPKFSELYGRAQREFNPLLDQAEMSEGTFSDAESLGVHRGGESDADPSVAEIDGDLASLGAPVTTTTSASAAAHPQPPPQ